MTYNRSNVPTPCYVVEQEKLEKNLQILKDLQERTGVKVLLAQKCFSLFALYPLLGQFLAGTTASGLYEARLGKEEMGKENHVYAPAYAPKDMEELVSICDHVSLNTPNQWLAYRALLMERGVSAGLRINPEYSTQKGHAQYDPCAPGSRLGTTRAMLDNAMLQHPDLMEGLEGLHFHTLCEQDADALEETLQVVERHFSDLLRRVKWVNLGGGHHITRDGYQMHRLEKCIRHLQNRYGVQVYLEPGEAVALEAGVLISTVLDTFYNGMNLAILDTSATCHMPDVLEMPYTPPIERGKPLNGPAENHPKENCWRLGGPTCLAGDLIGDYLMDGPLKPGRRLVFQDMAIYTMVKNNTFNGMPLPAIGVEKNGEIQLIRTFGYEDFKNRLS